MGRFSPDRDLYFVGGTAQAFCWKLIKWTAIIIGLLILAV